MTGDEMAISVDPAIAPGTAYVYQPGTGGALERYTRARFDFIDEDDLRFADTEVGQQWATMARLSRSTGLAVDPVHLSVPLQHATLEGFTRAAEGIGEAWKDAARGFGKVGAMVKLFADWFGSGARNPRRADRRVGRRRPVPAVPAIVPPGLSRVDSARARSARSALLRSARRAVRHNRGCELPPRSRPRISITAFDPKIEWQDPKRSDPKRSDRLDASLLALAATSRKD